MYPARASPGLEVAESAGREGQRFSLQLFCDACLWGSPILEGSRTYLSLVHFTAGAGSPTELQGSRTSLIQGVVTVPPKEMIFAGARGKRG